MSLIESFKYLQHARLIELFQMGYPWEIIKDWDEQEIEIALGVGQAIADLTWEKKNG